MARPRGPTPAGITIRLESEMESGILNPALRINLISPGYFRISRHTTFSARII